MIVKTALNFQFSHKLKQSNLRTSGSDMMDKLGFKYLFAFVKFEIQKFYYQNLSSIIMSYIRDFSLTGSSGSISYSISTRAFFDFFFARGFLLGNLTNWPPFDSSFAVNSFEGASCDDQEKLFSSLKSYTI